MSQDEWPEGQFWIRKSDCKCFISDGEKLIAEDGEIVLFDQVPYPKQKSPEPESSESAPDNTDETDE